MKTLTKTFIAIAASGFLATAIAEGEGEGNMFNKLDADADGMISAEEAAAHEGLQVGWKDADSNMDGTIDAAEFSAFEMKGAEEAAPEDK